MVYENATYNDMDLFCESNIKMHVLNNYGLSSAKVSQIKFKDTNKQRAVYKVEHQNKIYCLKKVYFSKDELLFVYSAIEWLYRNNINVPRFLPTLDNNRFVNYNNMLFILTSWVEGEKCDYDILEHTLACAATLGKMHYASKNFKPINNSSLREGYGNFYSSINKHFNNLLIYSNLAYKYKDSFSKIYLQNFTDNIELAKFSNEIAVTINNKNLSKSLCHLDYVNKNIIFDNNQNLWVIDFDKCKLDYCAHDISYCLRRVLRRSSTNWSIDLTINFLDLYNKEHPLTYDDYKYILVYLAFPQKYWKISRDYYGNINKCNKKSFINLLNKSVEYTNSQSNFAREFYNYINDKFQESKSSLISE